MIVLFLKKGSTTAKINALFINLTWNFSFKELLWVGLDFFPCESGEKADSFLFTYSRSLNNAEENILKPKKQHKTFSSRENDKKELLFWVNNPYAEGDFFLWMDNPFLIIDYKKYLFKDTVIRQFNNNYVLVMTCCELKWALRENEKGKVSVHVFYKRQPVTIRKNTIIYEMYDFFTTITKGLLFKDFIEVLSKRFPVNPQHDLIYIYLTSQTAILHNHKKGLLNEK